MVARPRDTFDFGGEAIIGFPLMQNAHSARPRDQRKMPVFIHSELDDYGLSPQDFRVYCHIARRAGEGSAWPGIDSISEKCRMNRKTVIKSIKHLELFGMLLVTREGGSCNVYILKDKNNWISKEMAYSMGLIDGPVPKEGTVTTSTRIGTGVVPKEGTGECTTGTGVVPKEGTKGSPLKVLHLRSSKEGSPDRSNKPSLDEMNEYGKSIELPQSEIERCRDHYESNGWKVGKNPMKNWQAAMRNWKRGLSERSTGNSKFQTAMRGNADRNQLTQGIKCKIL